MLAVSHGTWAVSHGSEPFTTYTHKEKKTQKADLKVLLLFLNLNKDGSTGSTETEYFLGIKEQYLRPSRTVVVINKRPINTLASEDGERHRESIKL